MAWKELLELHETKDELIPQSDSEARDTGSLISQVQRMAGGPRAEDAGTSAAPGALPELVCCRDGYLRRTPVQAYRTAEDFQRRRIRKALTAVIILIIAALLLLALMKAGLLVFRMR